MADLIDRDVVMVFLLYTSYLVWAAVPLIPAIIIYRLFPEAVTNTNWVISGVTLKAGGAASFYFAILGLAYFKFLEPVTERVNNSQYPVWTIEAPVVFYDSEKNLIYSRSTQEHMAVVPTHHFQETGDRIYQVKLQLVESKREIPDPIMLIFPEGRGSINLKEWKKTAGNQAKFLKRIDLTNGKPIEIRPAPDKVGSQSQASISAFPRNMGPSIEKSDPAR